MKRATRGSANLQKIQPISQYPQYIQSEFPLNKNFTYKDIPNTEQGEVFKEIFDKYDYQKFPFKGVESEEKGDTAAYNPMKRKTEKTYLY